MYWRCFGFADFWLTLVASWCWWGVFFNASPKVRSARESAALMDNITKSVYQASRPWQQAEICLSQRFHLYRHLLSVCHEELCLMAWIVYKILLFHSAFLWNLSKFSNTLTKAINTGKTLLRIINLQTDAPQDLVFKLCKILGHIF